MVRELLLANVGLAIANGKDNESLTKAHMRQGRRKPLPFFVRGLARPVVLTRATRRHSVGIQRAFSQHSVSIQL